MTPASSAAQAGLRVVPFDRVPGEVLPGSHLVIRVPGIAAVIRTGDLTGIDEDSSPVGTLPDAVMATATELLELLRAVADEHGEAPGRPLAHRLTRWVVGTPGVPGFGTVAATEDGIAVFLHGDVSLVEFPPASLDTSDGALPASASATGRAVTPAVDLVHLSGRTAAFTVDRLLPWPAGAIALSATDDPVRPPASPFAALGFGGLVNGLVPGDGIVLDAGALAGGSPSDGAGSPGRHAAPAAAGPVAAASAAPPAAPAGIRPASASPGRPADGLPLAGASATPAAVLPVATPPGPSVPPPVSPPTPPSAPRFSARIHGADDDAPPRQPLPVAGAKPAPDRPRPSPAGGPKDAPPDGPHRDRARKDVAPKAKAGAARPVGPVPAHALVKGFRCSRGHLNDPRVSFCSVCGIRMDQVTGVLVDGRRPPLGLLVLDIGSTFVLDDDYLLGRNPEVDPEVTAGRLRPIRLDDDSGTLSRVHAEIRLDNWDVVLVDRGSANGSYVASPGQAGWTRLAPRQPVVLTPGLTVRVGRRTFTFESSAARL